MNEIARLKLLGYLPTSPLGEIRSRSVDVSVLVPLLADRFCGHPDFADAEIANATPKALATAIEEDEDLCRCYISMHRRLLAATGSGSWPSACLPKYPKNHACTYWIDRSTFNSSHFHRLVTSEELGWAAAFFKISVELAGTRYGKMNMIDVALRMALDETYRRVGCAMVEVADKSASNVRITTRSLGGSTIGMAEFNSENCGSSVNLWIDSGYRPSMQAMAMLFAHEGGHNHNLEHEFTNQNVHHSVMSYSAKYPFVGFALNEPDRPNDMSLPILKRYYGGEPVPTDDPLPPPPPPPVPPGDFNGVFVFQGKVFKIKVYE